MKTARRFRGAVTAMVRGLFRLVSLVLVLGIVALSFAGCFRKKTDWIESNKETLFRSVLYGEEPGEVEIHALDAYAMDREIYFHVTYTAYVHAFDEWRDYDLVFFGTGRIENHFSFAWEDWGGMEKYRDAYYEAVEKGRHRAFSQEEIQEGVDAYYASLKK